MGTGISSEPRIFTIELPPGLPLLNANDRIHHRSRARITKELRAAAREAAESLPFTPFEKARVRCIFRAPNNRRRDVSNLYLSFKACLDGIIDSKRVLKDDCDKHVVELSLARGMNLPKLGQLIIQIIEVLDE
jgi:crossover junction endodeoxyribonuclease RusA